MALILSALVFTPVGVRMSFAREAGKIEDMFYKGIHVEDGGYTAPALYEQIETCQNSALGMLTIAGNYSGGDIDNIAGKLRAARETSMTAVFNAVPKPAKKSVRDRYNEYIAMYGFTAVLYDALAGSGLTGRDRAAADGYMGEAKSSFTLAMSQAAELQKKTDRLHTLAGAFPMWYMGGRGAWFGTISSLLTPVDVAGFGLEYENGRWNFRIIDGELIIT